jgi:hypothetical protein
MEREREREGKRKRKREYLFLKGVTGTLAPFSHLVMNMLSKNINEINTSLFKNFRKNILMKVSSIRSLVPLPSPFNEVI